MVSFTALSLLIPLSVLLTKLKTLSQPALLFKRDPISPLREFLRQSLTKNKTFIVTTTTTTTIIIMIVTIIIIFNVNRPGHGWPLR